MFSEFILCYYSLLFVYSLYVCFAMCVCFFLFFWQPALMSCGLCQQQAIFNGK